MKNDRGRMMHTGRALIFPIIVSCLLIIAACGGGGGDDGHQNGGPQPGGPGGNSGNPPVQLSFSVSGAQALVATQDTITQAAAKAGAQKTGSLFTYKVVNEKRLKPMSKQDVTDAARTRVAKLAKTSFAGDVEPDASGVDTKDGDEEEAGANLLAIDEQGNATTAIQTNYPIKVMYSVADPAGEYVYLALDLGWDNFDGNDYTRFIAQENCAFYRVTLADNSYQCVIQGLLVQKMDDAYRQNISGNQKPIQFDANSNVYFSGTKFIREENTWNDCCDENGNEISRTEYWLGPVDWHAQIYRVVGATGEISELSQDNGYVEFFLALKTGEIVYQVYDQTTWEGKLYVWQNGSTVKLTDQNWGVSFFTGDTNNAVIWGTWDWNKPGIFFARPRGNGLVGVEKTKLDTELFGASRYGDRPTPRRIIVGDDGRLYGVFESWQWDPENDQSNILLTVYQILPFDGVPKAQFTLSDSFGWWDWMGRTPFQVSQGFLYYTETEEVAFLGSRDVIRMVNLDDRTTTTLLNGPSDRYEIYSWRLTGSTLHFSAQDLSTTTVVTGEIDTSKVHDGEESSQYLVVNETASASGAITAIQDIEVIQAQASIIDDATAPQVTYHTNAENLYSVSLDFSQYMDKSSVESNLGFVEDPNGSVTDVAALKIWIEKTLHLIPDLSNTADVALGDSNPAGLNAGTTYEVALSGSVEDVFANALDTGSASAANTFSTRPDSGWYVTQSDSPEVQVSDNTVAKYAGAVKTNEWDYIKETFELTGFTVPENVQFEFSARNLGNAGVHVLLFNETKYNANWQDIWQGMEVSIRLGDWGWSNLEYKTSINNSAWEDGPTPQVFNGTWAKYRIKIFANKIQVWMSNDGTEPGFTEISTLSVSDVNMRSRSGNTLRLFLGLAEPTALDNLIVTALDSSGSTTGSPLVSENFDLMVNEADANGFFGNNSSLFTNWWW